MTAQPRWFVNGFGGVRSIGFNYTRKRLSSLIRFVSGPLSLIRGCVSAASEPRKGFCRKAQGCLPQASYPGNDVAKTHVNPNGVASASEAATDATPLGLKSLVSLSTQGSPPTAANPGLWDETPLGFVRHSYWRRRSEKETCVAAANCATHRASVRRLSCSLQPVAYFNLVRSSLSNSLIWIPRLATWPSASIRIIVGKVRMPISLA